MIPVAVHVGPVPLRIQICTGRSGVVVYNKTTNRISAPKIGARVQRERHTAADLTRTNVKKFSVSGVVNSKVFLFCATDSAAAAAILAELRRQVIYDVTKVDFC